MNLTKDFIEWYAWYSECSEFMAEQLIKDMTMKEYRSVYQTYKKWSGK